MWKNVLLRIKIVAFHEKIVDYSEKGETDT